MRKKQIGSTLESLFDELHERAELDLLTQKKRESGLIGDRPAESIRPQPAGRLMTIRMHWMLSSGTNAPRAECLAPTEVNPW